MISKRRIIKPYLVYTETYATKQDGGLV